MTQVLYLIGMLMHTIGLIIFGGGQIWIGVTLAIALKSKKVNGIGFALEFVEPIHKLMFTGFFLLGAGGLIRMYADNLFPIFADFSTLWGTAFFIKIVIYSILFFSGLTMAVKLTPEIIKKAPKQNEEPGEEFQRLLNRTMKFGQTDFLLTMVIIILAVVAVTQ